MTPLLNMLVQAWAPPGPLRFSPLAHGTNNVVQRVETPAGSYVLRVYSNRADLDRLSFEHAILARLAALELPFAVPAPLPTTTGDLFAHVAPDTAVWESSCGLADFSPQESACAGSSVPRALPGQYEDGLMLATLTHLIPGAHPRRDDLAQAEAAGAALGLLDATLAHLTPPNPEEGVSWRSYGDLAHCHPLVPDPSAAIRELPLADDARTRLLERYAWLTERTPGVYASLPRQLVHEDCGPDNMLLEGARVTGVLDFEFCTRDVRVMDLTVALSWWPVARFGSGDEWPIIRAVAGGYARHTHLAAQEITAMPMLFELRAYTSLIHRLGRYRQGLSPLDHVTERALAALERDDWLRANTVRFLEMVADASGN
jgi:homoserine kinase type II